MDLLSLGKGALALIRTFDGNHVKKKELELEIQRDVNIFNSEKLRLEGELLKAQSSIIKTEMKGSWIQRNWRPITMLTFLVLVVFDSFGWIHNRLSNEAWTLLQIGLGGYVGGRTLEKVVPSLTGLVKKR